MTPYLDMHDIPGVRAGDVVRAQEADIRFQSKDGVNYRHYWVDKGAARSCASSTRPIVRLPSGSEAHTLHEVRQGA